MHVHTKMTNPLFSDQIWPDVYVMSLSVSFLINKTLRHIQALLH